MICYNLSFKSSVFAAIVIAIAAAIPVGQAATPAAAGDSATASPLRQYLAAKHTAIEKLSAQEGKPFAIHAKITAESRSGVRRLRIGPTGEFQYLSDSGRDYAGYNLGAGSWPSLIGTLASAVADEYLVQAAAKGIALDSLDVVFRSIPERKNENLSYPNHLSYVAYIESPASDAQLEALRRDVEASSSALDLVTKPQPLAHLEVHYTQSPKNRAAGLPPGLRDFITEEKRPAVLAKQRQAARGKPAEPETLVARAHVEPHTGLRQVFIGKDGYHLQLHDSAPELLGYGLAPTVEEHLIGVSGTCLTHIFEVQAATRNVLLDSLQLTVDATLTPRFGKNVTGPARFKDLRYVAEVSSPASAQEIDALRASVEATCPLYNLIKDAQTVDGRIEHTAYRGQAI
ncbi:MAG: OsmC family protein [Pseudomonas sp.]